MSPRSPEVDAYVAGYPAAVQDVLEGIRRTVLEVAPTATETISYRMPTVVLDGQLLVHWAAYAKHVGLYPAPSGLDDELAALLHGASTIRLPLTDPFRFDLLERVVRLHVAARG